MFGFGKKNQSASDPSERARLAQQQSGSKSAKSYSNLNKEMEKQEAKNKKEETKVAKNETNRKIVEELQGSGFFGPISHRNKINEIKQEGEQKVEEIQNRTAYNPPAEQQKPETKPVQKPVSVEKPEETTGPVIGHNDYTPGTPKEKGNFDGIDYEREARASLEANGLGKYIGEDGKIDSKKLKRSKWGMAALNALLGGIAGFGAGIAGRDAPDMSNGMLGQHIGKLQEASDLTQQAAANKTQDERDLDTFTKQLNLGTEAQKNLAQAMIDMDMAKRDKLWKSLQAISDPAERNDFLRTYVGASEDIKDSLLRGGWKTLKESGVLSNIISGNATKDSDEGCKRFATRSVFR